MNRQSFGEGLAAKTSYTSILTSQKGDKRNQAQSRASGSFIPDAYDGKPIDYQNLISGKSQTIKHDSGYNSLTSNRLMSAAAMKTRTQSGMNLNPKKLRNMQRPGSQMYMREKKGNTNSITSLPKFSLQTEPKSHASTYYSVNNAVRQDAIQLSDKQQKAFVFRRLVSGLGKMGQ